MGLHRPRHDWTANTDTYLSQLSLLLWVGLYPPKFICCGPKNMTLFEDRVFKEVIKLKWGPWGRLALIQCGWSPYKKRLRCRHTRGRSTWRHWRTRPPGNQGERPQKKSTLRTPWSQASSPQNCEKIHLCYLSIPVCSYGRPSKLVCFHFDFLILSAFLSAPNMKIWTNCYLWSEHNEAKVMGLVIGWKRGGKLLHHFRRPLVPTDHDT